ncbi:MAG: DUF2782 domain-containing protein [Pseudomonadales bacterium]|nr:DUF2782 domain-containing protein [Pseudomonadales bacterium]
MSAALATVLACAVFAAEPPVITPPDESSAQDIEIVAGEDRTVFEYRTNGVLMMIKVVPKVGKPYYMVPADGSPHYESLDHFKKLYPEWVLLQW